MLLSGLPLSGMHPGSAWRRRARQAHLSRRPPMMTNGRSDLVDIAGELRRETQEGEPDLGAFLIFDGTKEVWVPKIFVEHDPSDGTFAMPLWLAREKGLI